ncbi:S1/P1 nuclease-domain-containing protein [Geranomyces variabilis]|nr:S1/P1 nuclease-domain-containing protein [Geranomyces variabilis]KAJ3137511.1 hypothetical protein HDU90_001914 [Geranomyces variabilis]
MKFQFGLSIACGFALGQVGQVAAWGSEGHKVVGSVAASLVQPKTLSRISQILASGESLESVATWADIVKKQRGNGDWHFIDVNNGNTEADNPQNDPTNSKGTCTPNLARDCGGTGNKACVVSVISQQGSILAGACGASTPSTEQSEALKYLVHFFGDVSQPLHACGYKRGGNDVMVAQFDSQTATQYGPMELHWIWDTSILVKNMGGHTTPKGQTVTQAQIDAYIAKLVSRIKTGDLKGKVGGRCKSPDAGTSSLCPLEWAGQANGLDCSAVFVGYDAQADLGGDYYAKNSGAVDQQLALAGVRLAAYLDEVLSCKGGSTPPQPTPTDDPTPATTATPTGPTKRPKPTHTPAPAQCPSADYPNYLFVRTENLCCSDPTRTSKKRYSYLCEESDGTVVRKYSNGAPFPPGKATRK